MIGVGGLLLKVTTLWQNHVDFAELWQNHVERHVSILVVFTSKNVAE
jgi:hypothetical protein